MQGKLDILAENAGEDGFVAGVCFLQDDSGEGECFFQDDPAERRSGAGCLPRLMLSASLSERLWRHFTPKRCDCWRAASLENAP